MKRIGLISLLIIFIVLGIYEGYLLGVRSGPDIVFIVLFIIFAASALSGFERNRQEINIPSTIGDSGYRIPMIVRVISTFKSAPSVYSIFQSGGAYPLFILFTDHIEFRILKKHSKRYDEIEYVDVLEVVFTKYIIIAFKDSDTALMIIIARQQNLISLLHFFQTKGIPLGDAAKNLLR